MSNVQLSSIETAAAAIARGEIVVVVDAADRENEGDLVLAAEFATRESINFMAVHGRGLICVPMRRSSLGRLRIGPMTAHNTDPRETAFCVGVDHVSNTTGISASDRAATIRALANPLARSTDFRQPGHVFPLAANDDGVLGRAGHTEAALDLVTFAGLHPAAVICEIMAHNGEMERLPGLLRFAARHGLEITTVSDLIRYRKEHKHRLIRSSARVPLEHGDFDAVGYRSEATGVDHVAFVLRRPILSDDALVHLHTECPAGDIFRSYACGCRETLESALRAIVERGSGAVVYLRRGSLVRLEATQERIGRTSPNAPPLMADSNHLCGGGELSEREYDLAVEILRDLGIERCRLLSGDLAARRNLGRRGIYVTEPPLPAYPSTGSVA